jgi:hypothetical protein
VTNDPYAGGSHLPDITVVRPVFAHGERIAFVACRGHHVDVGGITPGSMPPFSTRIEEEGFVLHAHRLVADGAVHEPDLPGCREPAVVLADLLGASRGVRDGARASSRSSSARSVTRPSLRSSTTCASARDARSSMRSAVSGAAIPRKRSSTTVRGSPSSSRSLAIALASRSAAPRTPET